MNRHELALYQMIVNNGRARQIEREFSRQRRALRAREAEVYRRGDRKEILALVEEIQALQRRRLAALRSTHGNQRP